VLGATQTARHFGGSVTAEELSFVDRRHIDIADLRAGSADLQNLYSQFELTKLWGIGESAAADGTHFETFKNNLLAARHFRYGKTGGIAYRHISDNYMRPSSANVISHGLTAISSPSREAFKIPRLTECGFSTMTR
jgi:TnpA family transposase